MHEKTIQRLTSDTVGDIVKSYKMTQRKAI